MCITEIRIVDDDGMLVLISAYTQRIVDHVYVGREISLRNDCGVFSEKPNSV